MAAAPPSRKEVAEWASHHCGHPVTQLERQCAPGVIYCQLFDAVRPGVLDSSKVKFTAHLSQHETLSNYKVLQESFEKIGDLASLDVEKLARGQPQATLDLLHKIYGLSTPESEAGQTKRGLSVLDANAVAQQGQTKRTRSAAAKQMKRPTRAFLEAHNRLSSVPNAEQSSEAGDAEATPSCEADGSTHMSTSESLHSALQRTHASLRQSRSEVRIVTEERDFYFWKLSRIEDVLAGATQVSSADIRQILYAPEEQFTAQPIEDMADDLQPAHAAGAQASHALGAATTMS